jgi:hypothetical protein
MASSAMRPSCAIMASPKAVMARPARLALNGITSRIGVAAAMAMEAAAMT